VKIGRVTASDRASAGVYEDLSGPAIEQAFADLVPGAHTFSRRLIPDDEAAIADALCELADQERRVPSVHAATTLRMVSPVATSFSTPAVCANNSHAVNTCVLPGLTTRARATKRSPTAGRRQFTE